MENANAPTTTRPSKPTAAATDCPPTADPLARFRQKFPTSAAVYTWFAPTHWERFACGITEALTLRPCPTLDQVAALYHDRELPRSLIRTTIHGLASLAPSSYNITPQAIDIAVGLFMKRYGQRCTLYQLMTYAANYQEYKRTLAAFDLNDVVSAYQRFEMRWGEVLDRARHQQQTAPTTDASSGLYGLAAYIRHACRLHPDGLRRFIATSNLVRRPTPNHDGLRVQPLGTFLPTDIQIIARAATIREAMDYILTKIGENAKKPR